MLRPFLRKDYANFFYKFKEKFMNDIFVFALNISLLHANNLYNHIIVC